MFFNMYDINMNTHFLKNLLHLLKPFPPSDIHIWHPYTEKNVVFKSVCLISCWITLFAPFCCSEAFN